MPVLSAYENIEYPLLMVRGWSPEKRRERVLKMIAAVDMSEHAHKRPDQMSGGQKQRVAVARALVGEPRLVLADEPTANLDVVTGKRVIEIFKELSVTHGVTVITATHDHKMLDVSDRIVWIAAGAVERIRKREDVHIKVGTIDSQ